jgi:leucine dehydrogenase
MTPTVAGIGVGRITRNLRPVATLMPDREVEPMVFDHVEFDDHEQITFVNDTDIGLRAIVAIHCSRGTTAGGGVRFRPYHSDDEALTDVLRLSRAMTYKMVLARLPVGGAKSVIIGDPSRGKTPDLLTAFGRIVESLNGRYTCGPDIGTDEHDMDIIATETDHVAGRSSRAGSTAAPTAVGVFHGLRATATAVFGSDELSGRLIAVQGAGGVGSNLARLLTEAGATVLVADVNGDAARAVADNCGATVVEAEDIMSADVDIVSPNAIGAVLDDNSIPTIRAKAVCGSANNQLARPEHAMLLADRGIAWAPDYVVGSGGAIAGVCDIGVITPAERNRKLAAVYDTTLEVLKTAMAEGRSTDAVAGELARALLVG